MILRGGLFVHTLHQSEVIQQPDSRMTVPLSHRIREKGTLSYLEALQRPSSDRTPGCSAFLAAMLWVCGDSLLAVTFV
jgi:hypothetical protein